MIGNCIGYDCDPTKEDVLDKNLHNAKNDCIALITTRFE